ncbi:hypothetical protein PVAP13_7KG342000 [Panicum virgatum]|uniref:Uncharacterized protein n=1 Tax=Panicum virgatum TaxID=38727 RepID=A0A8T0QM88_PANVG|nr:hypothetical protein PVAP13_7KG342000 [Panicum virgatum]
MRTSLTLPGATLGFSTSVRYAAENIVPKDVAGRREAGDVLDGVEPPAARERPLQVVHAEEDVRLESQPADCGAVQIRRERQPPGPGRRRRENGSSRLQQRDLRSEGVVEATAAEV